ncbi:ZAR1L protein, partial [Turnix velox]|nr:ZAR1L protein [Turnix velox]
MESFVYSPVGKYQNFRGGAASSREPMARLPSWKQNRSGGISPFVGSPFSALPSDYLEGYRRAQLQALLGQFNPGPALWPRRADTKEAGVQVIPRAEAGVQCSLEPRTLPDGRPLRPAALRGHLALFSPLPDARRLFALPKSAAPQGKEETSEGAPQERRRAEEEGGAEQQQDRAEAAPLTEATAEAAAVGEVAAATPRQRSTFQFLEQKYGYFHCKDCKTRWESAYVWCISGTNKVVYFKQLCRKCQKAFNPYRVEAIQC